MMNLVIKMKEFIFEHAPFAAIIFGLIVCGIIFFLDRYLREISSLFLASNLIIWVTFIAILWYSIETRLLKNATNTANTIQAEPLLALQFKNNNLSIVNYGKGVAFNIEMEIKNIVGFLEFSISNKNPLGYLEEKILLPQNQIRDQNSITKINLCFDNFNREKRRRIFMIFAIRSGYNIEYIG